MAAKKGSTPHKRPNAAETPRPVLSFRADAALYERVRQEAVSQELALSEVMERRLRASFDAETLEALLRRVVREEIDAEREATRAVVLKRVTSFRFGNQVGFVGTNPMMPDDALAVMADAQH